MSKRRKRVKKKKKAEAEAGLLLGTGSLPPNGIMGVGARFSGPMNPPECFPGGPPGFRPHGQLSMCESFADDDFEMTGSFMLGPGDHPRFHHPNMESKPPSFHLAQFRDGPPGFAPPAFRDGHAGFVPPQFSDRPPGFIPLQFRGEHQYPVMESAQGPVDDGGPLHSNCVPPMEAHGMPPDPPNENQLAKSGKKETSKCANPKQENKMNENVTTTVSSAKIDGSIIRSKFASVKPPAGRSVGVITFIGPDYGFIENMDFKKYWFSFEAFFGNRKHLLPGVEVHYTAVSELGKECATDVKVAPGGTEDIEDTVYEGVVITVLPDTYVLDPNPGRIRTIINAEPVKLPFGKTDAKTTLLQFDRVKFQLLRDIITNTKRATNITPQMPETFQLTKEVREKGVIMKIKDDTVTILSNNHDNLTGSVSEYLSENELKVMDEVEFSLKTVKCTVKAIRLLKLPEGSVNFDLSGNNQTVKEINSDPKHTGKLVSSERDEAGVEVVSSEKYDGTVLMVIPKHPKKKDQEPPHGLVNYTVKGIQKRLPFGLGDVMTQATMMIGDKVQFYIATKQTTKEERAVNIVINPATFRIESKEHRKFGVVVKLNANSGIIKTLLEPQLFFRLSEVLEDTKLTLSEKVEFTLAMNEEGKQAIRIRRLTGSVCASGPTIEEKKEKKKIPIKLKKDPQDQFMNKINVEYKDDFLATDFRKTVFQTADSAKDPKQKSQGIQDKPLTNKLDEERRRSGERIQHRSSSLSRDGSFFKRRRSSSRDRNYRNHRRSRSRSRDLSHRYRCSTSRERHSQSHRSRSRSPEYRDECRRRRRGSSSDRKTDSIRKTMTSKSDAPFTENMEDKLAKKRKELWELNELIARRKAILAMEQNTKPVMEKEKWLTTFDYQHKTSVEKPLLSDGKPVRSILKKHSISSVKYQTSERSDSTEALVEYPKIYASSLYTSAGSGPPWTKQSYTHAIEDAELARKKRRLQELSESIARKRAILAMEQKAKRSKTATDSASSLDDVDMPTSNVNTWQLDVKADIQPKKSILKMQSEGLAAKPQKDMTSADKYKVGVPFRAHDDDDDDDDDLVSPKPSGPSITPFEKSTNQPFVSSNPIDLFKKLIGARSGTSESSAFNKLTGQQLLPSTTNSPKPPYSHQDHEQAFTSKGTSNQPSTSERKSNLSKQMERFLGALNRADSNMMSSLLREDSGTLANQRTTLPADRKLPPKEDLYDPFSETDDSANSSDFLRRKQSPMLAQIKPSLDDYGLDDLLPHERAVQDGSGFSKIVGMKHGTDMAVSQVFFGGTVASTSKSTLSLKERDLNELSQGSYSDPTAVGYQNPCSPVQGFYLEGNKRKKESEVYRVDSQVHQKSKDTSKDVASKANKTLQDLLQTIGLNLDTAEVNKLADRTMERLYGKKVNPQSASSLSSIQNDEQSFRRSDRRDSSHSTDSEDVHSGSPAKSSNRKVYMSYLDSIKFQHDDTTVANELARLRRTVGNSPVAKPVVADPNTDTNRITEPSSLPQSVGSLYTQTPSVPTPPAFSHSYNVSQDPKGNFLPPYSTNPQYPLHYGNSYAGQYGYLPCNYGTYAPPVNYSSMMPSSFIPPVPNHPPPNPFIPSPAYSFNVGQFGVRLVKTDPFLQPTRAKSGRFLKTIITHRPKNCASLKQKQKQKQKRNNVTECQIEPRITRSRAKQIEAQLKDAEGEAETQAAPLMEDDIKAKQMKRLEQFNQRMRLKKEQQLEAQRLHGQSQSSAPGKVTQTEVKNVWICGHSLVFWAEKRATSPEIGMQLGMDSNTVRIWWKGVQGMTWQQLLPQLLQLKDNWPKPDVMIIHLGGNDIGKTVPEAFVAAVTKDVSSLKSIFPQCLLVWSDILPRKSWRHSDDSEAVNDVRATINKTIHSVLSELGGASLTHENIMPRLDNGLYRPDGVHLSGKGIDTFNLNMQDFLEKWENELSNSETSEV